MEKQRSREEELSLIVASILGVVNECAVRSCEDISKDAEIYAIIKNLLKDDSMDILHRNSLIFYLFNAVKGIDKKLREVSFEEKEFNIELMIQLQRTLNITSLHDFDEIENYSGGIAKFMGHKFCKEFNIEDAILEYRVNLVFMSYLLHSFYPAVNNAWLINNILEKRKEDQNKEIRDEKICPRCGKKNPQNSFRCQNEDCLDILPPS